MLGSCCEEQEAQEAAVRSRVRAATQVSEKRLFGRSLAAARAQSFCNGVCCEPVECQGCCEDEAWEEDEANDNPAKSDPRMAHNDDEDEAELLRRLRATRLSKLHSAAEKAAQPVVGYEYVEERTLLLLQDDAAAPPTVCLVGMHDDTELSAWLDDHLTVRPPLALAARAADFTRHHKPQTVAPLHPCARFMRVQDCQTLLSGLPMIRSLPVLLLLQRGIVLAFDQGLDDEREPVCIRIPRTHPKQRAVRSLLCRCHAVAVLHAQNRLRERIDRWLHEHSAKLAQPLPAMNSDSEEDEEGDGTSYCGRAGCRDYPHEHVAWKEKKPAEKRIVPRELRQI